MPTPMKRLLSLALAALMILPLASCATGGDESDTSGAATTTTPVVEGETVDPAYICDLPDNLNFNNTVINIMAVKSAGRDDELYCEGYGAGTVSDAVYERNIAVQDHLKVKLEYIRSSTDGEASAELERVVKAGDRSLDIFTLGTNWSFPLAISGNYQNLSIIENMDLSKSYWTQDYANVVTFGPEHKQYLATSSAAISLFRLTYFTIFNRDLFAQRQIPDLYDAVNNGTWTMDYQYSLITDTWINEDEDSNVTEGDFFGFVTGNCISVDAYAVAANVHLAIFDQDGYLQYNPDEMPKFVEMSEKVSRLYNDKSTYSFEGSTYDDIGKHYICQKFADQKCLMATTQFYSLETNINALAAINYGIVPMPKLYEVQKDYHTYVQDQVTSFGISGAIADGNRLALLGAVMESMAYHSYNLVRPAYYENTLSLRFMQDPQSQDILNTMFETVAFDYTYMTNAANIRDGLRTVITSSSPNIKSRMAGYTKKLNKECRDMNDKLEKLD